MASTNPNERTARKSISERLLERLQREAPADLQGLFSPTRTPHSLRPGLSARQAGAFSWELELTDCTIIGSQFTMSAIASAPAIGWSKYFSDWEVDPEPAITKS